MSPVGFCNARDPFNTLLASTHTSLPRPKCGCARLSVFRALVSSSLVIRAATWCLVQFALRRVSMGPAVLRGSDFCCASALLFVFLLSPQLHTGAYDGGGGDDLDRLRGYAW